MMKMADVKPGMRLRCTLTCAPAMEFVTVTELTDRGFRYEYDAPVSLIPRRNMTLAKSGHEHFGLDGEAHYEPA